MNSVLGVESDGYTDPFGDDIVTEPRRIEPAVAGVNDEALQALQGAFGRVMGLPLPRLAREGGAWLVLSPQPGYGKSHLLGRLFQELSGEATLLYLRPYQDARSCWISLVEKVVVELSFPDGAAQADAHALTQLDILARRVLGRVMTLLLRDERVPHPDKEQALALFERYPNTALEMPEFRDWLKEQRDTVLRALDRMMDEQGIVLQPNRRAWLKVLLAYAYSEADDELRQLCLDWIAYRPLDPSEGGQLGLRFAELPESDIPFELRNERCFERLSDLLTLGAYYRPFVLAFDQTELYGASPQLSRSLGVVLSRLRRECCNHLAVVTANTHVWQRVVRPHFEEADAHALRPQLIELHGMKLEQARALIESRLAGLVPIEDVRGFGAGFLPQLFEQSTERSARDVLRRARAQFQRRGAEQAPLSPEELSRMFDNYRRALLAQPHGLRFDAGVLQWCVQHLLGPALGVEVNLLQSMRGYLTLAFETSARRLLFGFETGSHWKRWDAILEEVGEVLAQRAEQGDHTDEREVDVCYLRLPDQKPLSQRTESRLVGLGGRVRVQTLTLEQAAMLFAAHDFAADVQQDNHAVGTAQVLSFLQHLMMPLAQMLWGDAVEWMPPEAPQGAQPARQLSAIGEQISAILERTEGSDALVKQALVQVEDGEDGEQRVEEDTALTTEAGLGGLEPSRIETCAGATEDTPSAPAANEHADTVELSGADFRCHTAVLGGAGSGKSDLTLNLVEQVLESNVPVLIVDRQGELARYADRAAWLVEDEPERMARRLALCERLDVALFTPGHGGGRPLRWTVVPSTAAASAEERAQMVAAGARIVGDLLRLKKEGDEGAQRDLLASVISLLAGDAAVELSALQAAVEVPGDAMRSALGGHAAAADLKAQLSALATRLAAFAHMQQDRLGADAEPVDAELLLGLGAHAVPGRVRLSIVNTQFVEGEEAVLSWVTQLLAALNRFASVPNEEGLRALVVFDEADRYLPAEGDPYTKAPLELLLKRGSAAGIGVVLSARHAGDLDYRCRQLVHTWLVGRVREPRALALLKPLAEVVGCDPVTAFANLAFGQFHMISDSYRAMFQGERSLLDPEPLSSRQILDLACAGRPELAPRCPA